MNQTTSATPVSEKTVASAFEVQTLIQEIARPDERKDADNELAFWMSNGWHVEHIYITTYLGEQEYHTRIVTLSFAK